MLFTRQNHLSFIGSISDSAKVKSSSQDRVAGTCKLIYFLSIIFALAIYFANFKREFYVQMDSSIIWYSPLFIYIALFVYLYWVVLYFINLVRGKFLLAAFSLCPIIAADPISRVLFQPLIPAASFVFVAAAGPLAGLIRHKIRLNLPTILFMILAAVYFFAWFGRGEFELSNSDIQYVSFAMLLLFFSNVTSNYDKANRVLFAMAWCVAIISTPDLMFFFNDLASGKPSLRLSYLGLGGANTFGVNIGLCMLILLLSPVRGKSKKGVAHFAGAILLGLALIFSGSRWQLLVVLLVGSMAIIHSRRRLLLVVMMGVGFVIMSAFADSYSVTRLHELDYSYGGRLPMLSKAIDIIIENPILGVGSRNWTNVYYIITGHDLPVHNIILAPFVYGGLLTGLFNIFFTLNIALIGCRMIASKLPIAIVGGWILAAAILIQFSIFYYTYLPFAVIGLSLTREEKYCSSLFGVDFSGVRAGR